MGLFWQARWRVRRRWALAGGERVFAERDGRRHRHELELHRNQVRGSCAPDRSRL